MHKTIDPTKATSDMTFIVTPSGAFSIGQHLAFVERMVAQGGPRPGEYASFDRWLSHIAAELRTGRMSYGELRALRAAFDPALSLETNQGLRLGKPHGYPGDYEIIDRIYREYTSDDPELKNWDLYFHTQAAPRAVRNRKSYFKALIGGLVGSADGNETIPVLNVASGPARDVAEFFQTHGADDRLAIECVDADANAIAYARRVCAPFLDQITFHEANALRFTTAQRYRLIWSAGLFDYFGDKGFKFLVARLLGMLADDGELVVGNFSRDNDTRDYMEVMGDWDLYYRSEEELITLAESCGVARDDIRVGREPEGVNLFLHVKRGGDFIPVDS